MSKRFDQLAARHSNLLARSAVQRRQLADGAADIEYELGRVDRGIRIVRRVLRSPATLGAAVAVVAFIGPRRLLRWGTRALLVYSTARQVAQLKRERAAEQATGQLTSD